MIHNYALLKSGPTMFTIDLVLYNFEHQPALSASPPVRPVWRAADHIQQKCSNVWKKAFRYSGSAGS
jgi:hypothetical protein